MGDDVTDGSVQSVDRAARILRLLAEEPALGVSEIARRLDVHRSTAFRLLATLEAHDLVEQQEHRGLYRLGLGLIALAGSVTTRIDLVRDAQVVCDDVEARFRETANVTILDGHAALNVVQTMSSQPIGVLRQYVGRRTPLHATATGKVLLAHAPAAVCDEVLAGRLERFTPATITTAKQLRAELVRVASDGWAAANSEAEENTNAVAVPVLGAGGGVVAALSVTAPAFRMSPEQFESFVPGLRQGADELSRRLGYVTSRAAS